MGMAYERIRRCYQWGSLLTPKPLCEVAIEPESLEKAAELGSSVLLGLLVDVIEVKGSYLSPDSMGLGQDH